MTSGSGAPLPKHVSKYLKDNDVEPDDVPNEVKETLANLSEGEIAVLQAVGDSLRRAHADKNLIAKVH